MFKNFVFLVALSAFSFLLTTGQSVTWSKDDVIAITQEWKGERLNDGRPKRSDDLLERLKSLGMADVWDVLRKHGFYNQFENFNGQYENPWMILHPDSVMTGRVLTAQFMPSRPDLNDYVQKRGKEEGNPFRITNSSPINVLQEGDVMVADGYGKIEFGTLIGDNLGNAIWTASKRGFVFNAGIRDWEGNINIDGFNGWFRGTDPSAIKDMTMTTINGAIRIGRVTVLPGDAVLARKNGVIFIPSYLVKEVVETSEFIRLKDEFQKLRVSQGTYEWKNEHFVGGWSQTIQNDFINWLEHHPGVKMSMPDLMNFVNKIEVGK